MNVLRYSALFAWLFVLGVGGVTSATAAEEPESAVGPVMRLLKSGRLSGDRLGNVVDIVCKRGNSHDLTFVFEQALAPDGFTGDVRLQVLEGLAKAARTRKVRPDADLSRLKKLLTPDETNGSPKVHLAAVRLAGLWQVESAIDELQKIAAGGSAGASPSRVREAAIDALAAIGGETSAKTLERLTRDDQPQQVRYRAAAALAAFDLDKAAERAAAALEDAAAEDDPSAVLQAFLDRQNGPQTLANALGNADIPEDVAKRALRYMYSVGRNDAPLSEVLSKAAGVAAGTPDYSMQELKQLEREVVQEGNPARGEEIFRRDDLSCRKCHSLNKVGGEVGPDLSSLGSSSPPDYVLRSILYPSESIKEEFKTVSVLTAEGKVLTGIVVDQGDERIVLKTAEGKEEVIPTADIVGQREGESLMPKGLTKFLTHDELVDLAAFLAQLGKPGPYAVPQEPIMYRWRVLKSVPPELAASVPDEFLFRRRVLGAGSGKWEPAYSKVSGVLPLDDLVAKTGSRVLYLYGEVDVSEPGKVGFRLNSAAGIHAWVDGQPVGSQETFTAGLGEGRHKVVLRVDTVERGKQGVRLRLFEPEHSPATADVVKGQ